MAHLLILCATLPQSDPDAFKRSSQRMRSEIMAVHDRILLASYDEKCREGPLSLFVRIPADLLVASAVLINAHSSRNRPCRKIEELLRDMSLSSGSQPIRVGTIKELFMVADCQ